MMQFIYLLTFALLAAAESCCDVKCYKALDKAPPSPHGHSAKADCSAYQIASVTPCPSTVTKTVDGPVETVTITSTYGQPVSTPKAIVSKRSKIHEANVNSCATTGKAAGIPVYATKDCKPADYASACSCLGIKQSTTTLARSIITSTYSAKSTTTITKIVTPAPAQTCVAGKCFGGILTKPGIASIASSFCKTFITVHDSTVTSTVSVTATVTSTRTPSAVTPPPKTSTITTVPTITTSSLCSTTVTSSKTTTITADFLTQKFFISRSTPAASSTLVPRDAAPTIPTQLIQGCPTGSSLRGILSSACSCIIKPTTTTTTSTKSVTSTVVTTAATSTLQPTTVTTVISKPTTTTVCSSTQTSTSTVGITVTVTTGTCGVPIPATATAPTSGQITCPSGDPGKINEYTRLEGSDSEGLIFEGCIESGPENITTPSGGTHECDGTNNGANPNPGANAITQIQSAAVADGFTFDGTFSTQFDDFFISRISGTAQTSTEFFGLLINQVFSSVGGCQSEVAGGTQELLWAFNAFNANAFLTITPQFAIVPVGTQTFTVNVQGHDGSGTATPFAGASIQGGSSGTTDANGNIAINVPTLPGCYEYKATAPNAIRSNIFYLSVVV